MKLCRYAFVLALPLLPATAAAQDKVRVVATFSILADMTAKIAGERASVTALVGAGADAHVYKPTPADAATLAKAQLVVQNGLKFEGWIERLIKSSGTKGEIVTATKGITPLKVAGKQDGHGHAHGSVDPHAWQSLANAVVYVANIRDALCKVDVAGCPTFTANAAAYSAELTKLDADIKATMERVPAPARKVIASHDAFGYFAEAYGIRFLAPRGVSTESEPSAKDVARLIDQIRREKVKALFIEKLSDPRLIEQIGRETGIKPAGALYSDALSPADGPAATYIDMMRFNARQISGAMGAGS